MNCNLQQKRQQIRRKIVRQEKQKYFNHRRLEVIAFNEQQQITQCQNGLENQQMNQNELLFPENDPSDMDFKLNNSSNYTINMIDNLEVLLRQSLTYNQLLPQIRGNQLLQRLKAQYERMPNNFKNCKSILVLLGNILSDSLNLTEKQKAIQLCIQIMASQTSDNRYEVILENQHHPSSFIEAIKHRIENICQTNFRENTEMEHKLIFQRLADQFHNLQILIYAINSILPNLYYIDAEQASQTEKYCFENVCLALSLITSLCFFLKQKLRLVTEKQIVEVGILEKVNKQIYNFFKKFYFDSETQEYDVVHQKFKRNWQQMSSIVHLHQKILLHNRLKQKQNDQNFNICLNQQNFIKNIQFISQFQTAINKILLKSYLRIMQKIPIQQFPLFIEDQSFFNIIFYNLNSGTSKINKKDEEKDSQSNCVIGFELLQIMIHDYSESNSINCIQKCLGNILQDQQRSKQFLKAILEVKSFVKWQFLKELIDSYYLCEILISFIEQYYQYIVDLCLDCMKHSLSMNSIEFFLTNNEDLYYSLEILLLITKVSAFVGTSLDHNTSIIRYIAQNQGQALFQDIYALQQQYQGYHQHTKKLAGKNIDHESEEKQEIVMKSEYLSEMIGSLILVVDLDGHNFGKNQSMQI